MARIALGESPARPAVGGGFSAPSAIVGIALVASDAIAIVAAGLLSRAIYRAMAETYVDLRSCLGLSLLAALLFTLLARSSDLYETRTSFRPERQIRTASIIWAVSLGILLGAAFVMKASADLSRGAMLTMAALGLVFLIVNRFTFSNGLRRAVEKGLVRRRSAIVLNLSPSAPSSDRPRSLALAGLDVSQNVTLPKEGVGRAETISRVIDSTRSQRVDEVILQVSSDSLHEVDTVLEQLRSLPLPIRLMPDATLSRLATQPSRRIGRFALVDISREPLSPTELAAKRALDVAIASLLLLFVAPLLIIAIAAIRLESEGSALFRQTRRGFNGRTFQILKLRSMRVCEDDGSVVQATRADPRVTRVGAWLRRTSIDELPQLWNVVRGEMSIVGPRPHAVAHDDYYDILIENYAFRHHVKPGLTGWAQVNGHRGETPKVEMMAARVEHDVWYINNWSLLLDIRILMMTATRLFARTAY